MHLVTLNVFTFVFYLTVFQIKFTVRCFFVDRKLTFNQDKYSKIVKVHMNITLHVISVRFKIITDSSQINCYKNASLPYLAICQKDSSMMDK